jgi:hypothetical protein
MVALVVGRLDIFDYCAIHNLAWNVGGCGTVCLARDQIEMAGDRNAEVARKGVIAHRVMLSVIPNRRDGVAVVVTHRQVRDAPSIRHRACELNKHIQEPAVICLLLVHVEVRVVAGLGLGAIQPERVCEIEILIRDYPAMPFTKGVFGSATNLGSPGGLAAAG